MKTILLIEDNDDIRNNTAEILELSNYKVVTAENGKEGMEKAMALIPDLIICDIMMPVMDGYAVLYAIHNNEETKNIPFIFLTAKSERSDLRKGMEMGADDYITKPFSGIELLTAVESRLKKIDLLKEELSPGLEGLQFLLQASKGKDLLQSLTEDRNINKYKKKQLIYTEGNHPNRLFYVIKGKVKIFKCNDEGKELVMELLSQGDFLGYVAMLEGGVYKDNAEAMEETELAVIPKEDFEELVNNNKEVSHKFISLLASNLALKESQLLAVAYNSLRKKVADALLLVQQKYSSSEQENFVIDINRENMATIAGTAKESLIRTLSDFRNEKLVEINKDGNIIILNRTKLENLMN